MTKTYVVEHLDPELGPWSALEYTTIAQESHAAGANFCLSSVSDSLEISTELSTAPNFNVDKRSSEDIFSDRKSKVCLLDPKAEKELDPSDGDRFDVFLFGGILGDDPPRDRTSELRKLGFEGRRLGPVQMTTDTAVRVTRKIAQDRVKLDDIPYVDFPEIRFDEHESTEMPFRYVVDKDQKPIMPDGMIDLIKADADKGLDDLL